METVVGLAGAFALGAAVGLALGLLLAHRRETVAMKRVASLEARVRASVIPILERRAETLGVPASTRAGASGDAFEVALSLAHSVQRTEESLNIGLSDTLQVARSEVQQRRRNEEETG